MAEKNKGGRPKAEDPKNKIVTLRLTGEQFAQLEEYSEEKSLTKTQVILEGLEKLYSE